MKLGIKVGPRPESIRDLEETNAPFAEVWFRINKKDDYNELFAHLRKKKIDTGLHFWGLTRDGILPGLVFDNPSLLQESIDLMKKTIDVASQNGFSYVNVHPGYRRSVTCDFTNMIFTCTDDHVVPYEQAARIFLENVTLLNNYAKDKNVLLTVETTPLRMQTGSLHDTKNRKSVEDFNEYSYVGLPVETLPFAIANDFGHTAANCISDTVQPVRDLLLEKTQEYFSQTRLIHIGYIVPPFNGTDLHDQMDNPEFDTPHAVPNKKQLLTLLGLFKNRRDVWALVEPNGQHPKNYFLAQKLLSEA